MVWFCLYKKQCFLLPKYRSNEFPFALRNILNAWPKARTESNSLPFRSETQGFFFLNRKRLRIDTEVLSMSMYVALCKECMRGAGSGPVKRFAGRASSLFLTGAQALPAAFIAASTPLE